jgi:enoyl-CoA hydratase/carnithine racemase
VSAPLWHVSESEGVVTAAHDNAPMNYLTADGVRELSGLVDRWRSRQVRAVVLTSAHRGCFITHYSVEELLASQANRERLLRSGRFRRDAFQEIVQRLNDLEKPVIAAMNGDTMGGGLEISLACDIRIAERGDYRYGLPEVRLGIIPGGSGTQRLARLIGAGNAVEFCLRARVVTPERALELGLVHELVDDAVDHAVSLAHELAAMPPVAIAMVKRSVYAGADLPLAGAVLVEQDACYAARLTQDAVRAMEAYLAVPLDERRDWLEHGPAPRYTGA